MVGRQQWKKFLGMMLFLISTNNLALCCHMTSSSVVWVIFAHCVSDMLKWVVHIAMNLQAWIQIPARSVAVQLTQLFVHPPFQAGQYMGT